MLTKVDLPLSDPRDRKGYIFHVTALRRLITLIIRFLFGLVADLQVCGLENMPASGPVVLVANHLTNFDVFAMQLAISRPIFFMGKAELFRNALLEFLLRQLGSFPVYRSARDEWALRHAEQLLQHGQILGIFPEGTRSRGHGLRAAKSGAARLALSAGCPILPMAINGTQGLFKRFPRRAQVTVILGKPLFPWEDEQPLELTDRAMFSLAGLLPQDLRGVYAGARSPGG